MREIDLRRTFKQDYKLVKKQNWNLKAIDEALMELQSSEILDKRLKDHALIGDYKDFRECHIYGDLVIIYQRTKTILTLYRIGRHQDLFKGY